jgi:hypothetical protein
MADAIREYRLTDHAKFEMRRRQISETEVTLVLKSPQQVKTVREGRKIYQSIFETEEPTKDYLIRVVVDIDRSPPEVVTVYRTSKIDKYWSSGS